jgi:hypothetical protein
MVPILWYRDSSTLLLLWLILRYLLGTVMEQSLQFPVVVHELGDRLQLALPARGSASALISYFT